MNDYLPHFDTMIKMAKSDPEGLEYIRKAHVRFLIHGAQESMRSYHHP